MIMLEKSDVFRGMKKVNSDKFDNDKPLPYGYVTDGYGNIYKVPDKGYSKYYGHGNYKFRYNYGKREVEIYEKHGNKFELVDTMYLNVNDWVDNPEYWLLKFLEE